MFLTIHGGSKKQREIAKSAVIFAKQRLIPKIRTIELTLRIVKVDSGLCGYCDDVSEKSPSRQFVITVRSDMSDETLVSVIFHEMVHLQQSAAGKLKEVYVDGVFKLVWSNVIQPEHLYKDQPWEHEAQEMEKILISEYTSR
jgi:hypothetical protein